MTDTLSSTLAIPETGDVPRHVAIIMDGNGRWATRRMLPRTAGHVRGVQAVRRIVEACGHRGVRYLTLFAFSSENWRRPAQEVSLLMRLFVRTLEKEVDRLEAQGVRLRVVGDLSAFDPHLRGLIEAAERRTAGQSALTLTIAANYGGRWDIVNAARHLAERVANRELEPDAIDEHAFQRGLCLGDEAPIDLCIRTSGEQRISNFLLWQMAYAELYFTPLLWPDFDGQAFDMAIDDFCRRQRRFGMTDEQIEAKGA